jgi:hypothetical protein
MAALIYSQRQLTLLAASISEVLEQQDQVLASIAVSCGLEQNTEDSSAAFINCAAIAGKLQEALHLCSQVRESLTAYGSRF